MEGWKVWRVPFGGMGFWNIFQSQQTFPSPQTASEKFSKPTVLKNTGISFHTWILWLIIHSGVELDSDIPMTSPTSQKALPAALPDSTCIPGFPVLRVKPKLPSNMTAMTASENRPLKGKNIEFSNQHCSSFFISIYPCYRCFAFLLA